MFNTNLSTNHSTRTISHPFKSLRRGVAMVAAIVMLVTVLAMPAYPQTPAATLRMIDPQSGYQYATVEIFSTASNAFGFWARVWMNGTTKLRTAVPFKTNSDGSIAMWFIEYSYYQGAPLDTHYWTETYSGQVLLTMATATATSIDGFMIITAQMVGYQRVAITDQWRAIRLTA
ncbi:MAG: hypothetical protein HY231_18420 [Acidobacteria bacterium]|nr:hypothetical protein [Acidobacteriota bacterium]